jgi:hypothetical protein
MKPFLASIMLAAIATTTAVAHECSEDAKRRAMPLLALHFEVEPGGDTSSFGIADEVTQLAPVKSLRGNGRFDVLEVWGYIYKAEYRMRFLYAQIPGSCVLMGQEILEASDPY